MLLKCLEIAFETKYSLAKLSDAELAALIRLQHSLWWQRIVLSYLLDDFTGRFDELEKKCRLAINEALKRLAKRDDSTDPQRSAVSAPQLLLSLIPVQTHFQAYEKKIEKIFVAYIQDNLNAESLTMAQKSAFVAIYALLRGLHASFRNPDYEFVTGKEKAQGLLDEWISSFDEQSGWVGLPLGHSLARLECIQDGNVRYSLKRDWRKADAIFSHFMQDTSDYGDQDFCNAVVVRSSDIDKAEEMYAAEDLARSFDLVLNSPDLATRLMAARSVIEVEQSLYLEEATAVASLPESARKRYAKAVKTAGVSAMADDDLFKVAQLAFSVINTLYSLEEENGFLVDNLKIAEFARQLCNELVARGDEKMLRLAKKIGFGDSKIDDVAQLWAIGATNRHGDSPRPQRSSAVAP